MATTEAFLSENTNNIVDLYCQFVHQYDVKHSGSDHRHGISAPIFRTLPLLRHLRERNE